MSRKNRNARPRELSEAARQLSREVREVRRASRAAHRARSIELKTARLAAGGAR